jgi:hypothetical protein
MVNPENTNQASEITTDEGQSSKQKTKRGPGSFCIPRATCQALLESGAGALEICSFLVLARFTDKTGQYTTASKNAISKATNSNKSDGGPIEKALEKLQTIRATRIERRPNIDGGKPHEMIEQAIDLGPILIARSDWQSKSDEALPDGPHARARVTYVLPDFGEPLTDRVWFGNGLVKPEINSEKSTRHAGSSKQGDDLSLLPLRQLKNAGGVAAWVFLYLNMNQGVGAWGGISPVGAYPGPWHYFKPTEEDVDLPFDARLIRAKEHCCVLPAKRGLVGCNDGEFENALSVLASRGLIYKVVLAVNRDDPNGDMGSDQGTPVIPHDAEPLFELDTRSIHGYKPVGEEGIGGAMARTAGEMRYPVTNAEGQFNGTYAALVPRGQGVMIVGIFRLRWRVANPENYGVRDTWRGIGQRNMEGLNFLHRFRRANGLTELDWPIAA